MQTNKFYFLKDDFLKKYNLMQNKGAGKDRPFFCCIKDLKTPGIYWMIPCSTKLDKYNAIYQKSVDRFGRCNTIDFIKIYNKQMAVIIKSAVPCINKYIKNKYVNQFTGDDIQIKGKDAKRLEYKLNQMINKEIVGKHISFYNLFDIYNDLSVELQIEKQEKLEYIKSLLESEAAAEDVVDELIEEDFTMSMKM